MTSTHQREGGTVVASASDFFTSNRKDGLPWEPRASGSQSKMFSGEGPGDVGANSLLFYVGLHHPSDAKHFVRCCISINSLRTRRKRVECDDVFIDGAGYTTLDIHGDYLDPPRVYAAQLHRLYTQRVVRITVAASQDYMCETHMLAKTGLSIEEHQRRTIERYDAIKAELHDLFDGPPPFQLMPVLQGFSVADYLRHLADYGERLTSGMWVGVGSVCKRQGDIAIIEDLLLAIAEVRPDLRLHGFRSEAHCPAKPNRQTASVQRGQHGVVLRSQEGCGSDDGGTDARIQAQAHSSRCGSPVLSPPWKAPARRQRLARGQALRRPRSKAVPRARAIPTVLKEHQA